MNTDNPSLEKAEPTKYTYVASLYFIIVGVLYLWGYWGTFEINILEFASIADIIKTTAYPIATTFASFVVGSIIGVLLADSDPPSNTSIGVRAWTFVFRYVQPISLIYFSCVFAFYYFGPDSKWRLLPVLIAFPIFIATGRHGFLTDIIPHARTRYVFTYLLITLPLFSYGHGKLKALEIIKGHSYSYPVSPISEIKLPKNTPENERSLRYLGQVNDYLFFYVPDTQTTAIARFDQMNAIQIARYEIGKNKDQPDSAENSKPEAANQTSNEKQ